jgi:hypothetical protein
VVAKNRSAQIVHRTLEAAGFPEKVVEFTIKCQEYRRKNAVAQASPGSDTHRLLSRRKLFAGVGVSMMAPLISSNVFSGIFGLPGSSFLHQHGNSAKTPAPAGPLYPPVDLSYFETPFGYRT